MFVRALAVLALCGVLSLPAGAQQDFKDEVRKLLNDGMDLYKQGKYAEAHSKFEEAFQKQPDSDLVYAFIQRAGQDAVAGMMSSPDDKTKADGYRLFELAKPGEMIRRSRKVVLKYLEDLKSQDFAVVRNAHWHLKNFGPWAVRFVLPALANEQQDIFRSRILQLLTEMGTDATLGVVECLKNKESVFMRQNAAIALGNIKDDRALPALKRVYEDATEQPEVKKFALEALLKITRKPSGETLRSAREYYYELAEKYYHGHSSVIHAWNRAYLVWSWDAAKKCVTEREVPRFSYGDQLAEQALYELLALDPAFEHPKKGSAWSLLVCVHFAQCVAAEGGLAAAEQAQAAGDPGILPDHVETLKKQLANWNRHTVLASLPGKRFLYEALARSMKEGNTGVSKACIEAIKEMGRPQDLPAAGAGDGGLEDPLALEGPSAGASGSAGAPLIDALTNEDKRVRYAAAEAMVGINPTSAKLGNELVIPNLVDALGEQGVRIALVIYDVQDEADRSFINAFRSLLIKVGVHPIIASSGEEGVLKARQFPGKDVFIVQRKLAGQVYFKETEVRQQVVESVFDALREDIRTRHTPRVILADSAAELAVAKKDYEPTAQGFIARDEALAAGGHLALQGLFERLFGAPEAKKDSKDRANDIARSAAEALASIDITHTLFPYLNSVDALIKTLSPQVLREDSIRLPAAKALGHFGDPRGLDVMAKVLADKPADADSVKRQKPLRLACAQGVGRILKLTGMAPAKEIYEALKSQLNDGDYDLELAVGEALGNSALTPAQKLEVAEIRRLNSRRETKTPDDE